MAVILKTVKRFWCTMAYVTNFGDILKSITLFSLIKLQKLLQQRAAGCSLFFVVKSPL